MESNTIYQRIYARIRIAIEAALKNPCTMDEYPDGEALLNYYIQVRDQNLIEQRHVLEIECLCKGVFATS